jgi:hypothetical protein
MIIEPSILRLELWMGSQVKIGSEFVFERKLVPFLKISGLTALTAALFANFPAAASVPAANDFGNSLNISSPIFTKESIVEVSGIKYRKVEYRKEIYYFQLLDSEKTSADLQILCSSEKSSPFNANSPVQIVSAVKVTRRMSAFVDGLKQVCVDQQGGKHLVLSPELRIGFMFANYDDELLKNKQIYVSPFSGPNIGFKANW